jgi:hypothetical protein
MSDSPVEVADSRPRVPRSRRARRTSSLLAGPTRQTVVSDAQALVLDSQTPASDPRRALAEAGRLPTSPGVRLAFRESPLQTRSPSLSTRESVAVRLACRGCPAAGLVRPPREPRSPTHGPEVSNSWTGTSDSRTGVSDSRALVSDLQAVVSEPRVVESDSQIVVRLAHPQKATRTPGGASRAPSQNDSPPGGDSRTLTERLAPRGRLAHPHRATRAPSQGDSRTLTGRLAHLQRATRAPSQGDSRTFSGRLAHPRRATRAPSAGDSRVLRGLRGAGAVGFLST